MNLIGDIEFNECIKDLLQSETVQKMAKIPQHAHINCLDHSIYVSYLSFKICRFLKLDYVSAARGGLLHDLFLYDWREKGNHQRPHLFTHPRAALNNALREFKLNEVEQDVILKHMWPFTIKLPKYMESLIVNLADNICAITEVLLIYKLMKVDYKMRLRIA